MLGKLDRSKLSKKDYEQFELARDKYTNAFRVRATNPADFDTNIACLRELAESFHCWMDFSKPHVTKIFSAEERMQSRLPFFRYKAKGDMKNEMLIIEIYKKQMVEAAEEFMKEQFIIEPRIKSVEYSESLHAREVKKGGDIICQEYKEMYTITFSDNDTIILSDLEPESIEQARIKFTEKMNELAETKSNMTTSL